MADEEEAPLLKNKPSSIDDMIEIYLGSTGLFQLMQLFLLAFASAFDAQQTFINVFTDKDPAWHCNADDVDGFSTCLASVSPCGLPQGSWSWNQPKHASMVSEWNLQCSPSVIIGMPASAYFVGCLAGGLIFATLADSALGRKKVLVVSCLTMSLSGVLSAFSPNVWVYAALRFVCGLGRSTVSSTELVLSTEIVGKRWRDPVSIIGFFFFAMGFLSLPGIAYLGEGSSWRNMYMWTSVPALCYTILIYFLIKESPRWLLVRGRKEEAIDTLKYIAKSDGRDFSPNLIYDLTVTEEKGNVDMFSALRILWAKPWAFYRLKAVMAVGFGIGMVYYGMPLNVGNLGSNLYISVALNALSEVPSALITLLLIRRINRRGSLLVFTAVSAITSVLCVFLLNAHGWEMAVEVVSFFSACTAFNVLLIYCVELFPTCVRNSAISLVRQALVLGGAFAPLMVAEGRKRRWASFGVFGLAIGCCGLFAVCLPETKGNGISDTIEEEESKEVIKNAPANLNS